MVDVRARFRAVAAKVKPLLRLLRFAFVHNAGENNALAPDNRRRPAAAGHVSFPDDVLVGVPLLRQGWAVGHAGGWAAKLGPIFVRPERQSGASKNEDRAVCSVHPKVPKVMQLLNHQIPRSTW